MTFSFIIPFHSNETYLQLCINSLLETTPQKDSELIIIINNSNNQYKHIKFDDNRVKIYRFDKNLGYGGAINKGAELARGKYLCMCDSDTVYYGSWFKYLSDFHLSNKDIGISSSKLINPHSGKIIDFGMGLTKYNNPHPYMDRDKDFELTRENKQVQMACSANMLIDKEVFMQMGMHNEELFNFYSDTDLCLRLKEFKKECWVVANSIAYHQGNSTSNNRSPYNPDIKGWYIKHNYQLMEIDMDKYFDEAFKFFKFERFTKKKFVLLDLSTIADKEWHHNLIKQYFKLLNIYEYPYIERDVTFISLIEHLNYYHITLKIPIIYFVDRFVSLQNNQLWFDIRANKNDLIIDRNANIISAKELY